MNAGQKSSLCSHVTNQFFKRPNVACTSCLHCEPNTIGLTKHAGEIVLHVVQTDSRERDRRDFNIYEPGRIPLRLRLRIAHLITRNATMNGDIKNRTAAIRVCHPPCSSRAKMGAFYSAHAAIDDCWCYRLWVLKNSLFVPNRQNRGIENV